MKKIFFRKYLILSFLTPVLISLILVYSCGNGGSSGGSDPAENRQAPPGNPSVEVIIDPDDGVGSMPIGYLDITQTEFKYLRSNGDETTNPVLGGCVLDVKNNLVWENKTAEEIAKIYTWEQPDSVNVAPEITLDPLDSSTAVYVADLNTREFCGKTNWRVPTDVELLSIFIEDFNDVNHFDFQSVITHNQAGLEYDTNTETYNFNSLDNRWEMIQEDDLQGHDTVYDWINAEYDAGATDEVVTEFSGIAGPLRNFLIGFHIDQNKFTGFLNEEILKANQRFLSTVSLEANKPAILLGVPFGAVYGYDRKSGTEGQKRLITYTEPFLKFRNLSYQIYKAVSSNTKISGHLLAVSND